MTLVDKFVTHVISESSFEEMDRIYLTNRVLSRVGEGVLEVETNLDKLIDLKDQLVEETVRLETIEDSQTAREILGTELMDLVTPCPSQVNRDFWEAYAYSPEQAIEDFYQLSQKNDYIKLKAIAKNIAYRVPSDYGELEITINLSKPEKDPKEIAVAKLVQASNYPQCQLCLENEGYHGRVNHPARSNHRIIRFEMVGQEWGFQYSDSSVQILAETDGTPHHTITPIARKRDGQFELDLVLRDNQTSAEHPDGIYHPHKDVQHIKKENIGLIEVMGLAILPPRLKEEVEQVASYLVGEAVTVADYHQEWADQLKSQHPDLTDKEKALAIVKDSVGAIFVRVLEDAGVYKQTEQGQTAFMRFVEQVGILLD